MCWEWFWCQWNFWASLQIQGFSAECHEYFFAAVKRRAGLWLIRIVFFFFLFFFYFTETQLLNSNNIYITCCTTSHLSTAQSHHLQWHPQKAFQIVPTAALWVGQAWGLFVSVGDTRRCCIIKEPRHRLHLEDSEMTEQGWTSVRNLRQQLMSKPGQMIKVHAI